MITTGPKLDINCSCDWYVFSVFILSGKGTAINMIAWEEWNGTQKEQMWRLNVL